MQLEDSKVQKSLESLDSDKRKTLGRLIAGGAFVAPVVAAFAMQGISVRPAHAQIASSSNATVSDRRLKKNILWVGSHPRGFGIYRFNYLWSDTPYVGVLAQEVMERAPDAVTTGPGGYLAVEYAKLGMAMRREVTGAAV
ncbi:MAG: tail fiber domain-containing protein [Sphingobacteriales bacterium]